MTPKDIEAIIEAMRPVCFLCAMLVGPSLVREKLCRACSEHVKVHRYGSDDEVSSESFAVALGLTKGVRTLSISEFRSENERMAHIQRLVDNVNSHSIPRRIMLKSRFCALYLPALSDALCSGVGTEEFQLFEPFIHQIEWVCHEPFYAKFILSDDPRAVSANRLARAIARQMYICAPKWTRDMDDRTFLDDTPLGALVAAASTVLVTIMALQVDKPYVSPIDDDVRKGLLVYARAWVRRCPAPSQTSHTKDMTALLVYLGGVQSTSEHSRGLRTVMEGLQKCARKGCDKTDDLFLCAGCRVVTYCGRKHQREDWNGTYQGDPDAGHKRVCYQSCF